MRRMSHELRNTCARFSARFLARRAHAKLALAALVMLALASCATTGLQPVATNMPIERASLRPEYRVFYDALQGEGDWTLIEPFGYVFRPDVNFVAWSPYEQGFWVPSDVYGWVWISTEPFGWATYHYGRWMYDSFQGWVWAPGNDWAPAWVTWEMAGPYVGWAPLIADGVDRSNIPGGGWHYAPMSALATTDLSSRLVSPAQIHEVLRDARPIRNLAEVQGVVINRGPDLALVERVTGPLQRVKIVEPPLGGAARPGKRELGAEPSRTLIEDAVAIRKAGEEAARLASGISRVGAAPPPAIPLVRPLPPPRPVTPAGDKSVGRGRKVTAPDSTGRDTTTSN